MNRKLYIILALLTIYTIGSIYRFGALDMRNLQERSIDYLLNNNISIDVPPMNVKTFVIPEKFDESHTEFNPNLVGYTGKVIRKYTYSIRGSNKSVELYTNGPNILFHIIKITK